MQTLLSDAYLQRFAGIGRLYGQQALRLFARSHFCVVGIGGVGSWAAEALARTGIGAITLIDMDDVCDQYQPADPRHAGDRRAAEN